MTKSIEPIILAVALAFLALGAAALAYWYPSLADITGITSMEAKGHTPKALTESDIESSLAIWNTPVLWNEPEDHQRLFDSDEYLFFPADYPNGTFIKKVDQDIRSSSGVLLSWYQKYNLDFTDPKVDREDPDGDGFSNIVEFRNDPVGTRQKASDCDGTKSTNPLDPKAHPSYLSRLRLQKYETRPFHIQFKGYEDLDGKTHFQIYLNDVPSQSQPPLKVTGDQLGFEGYIVGAFVQKFEDIKDPNTDIVEHTDVSTLELDKPDIGLKVVVPFRKEIDSPESTADFVILMPSEVDKVLKVSRGKIFTAPYIPKPSYQVIDTNDDGATIRDTDTKQEYHILKLDPAEWNDVPVAPASTTTTNTPQSP
jgi:hypothetical protein